MLCPYCPHYSGVLVPPKPWASSFICASSSFKIHILQFAGWWWCATCLHMPDPLLHTENPIVILCLVFLPSKLQVVIQVVYIGFRVEAWFLILGFRICETSQVRRCTWRGRRSHGRCNLQDTYFLGKGVRLGDREKEKQRGCHRRGLGVAVYASPIPDSYITLQLPSYFVSILSPITALSIILLGIKFRIETLGRNANSMYRSNIPMSWWVLGRPRTLRTYKSFPKPLEG